MTWAAVVAGGMVGAVLRHLANRVTGHPRLPWSTFAVNVVGSLLLGVLAGLALSEDPVRLFFGTGLCGALTTYSTFAWETLRLVESGARPAAAANVAGSVIAGVGAVWVGASL